MKVCKKRSLLISFFLIFTVINTTIVTNVLCTDKKECPICCYGEEKGVFIALPCCGKNIHKECMDHWHKESAHYNCPFCRKGLEVNTDGSYRVEGQAQELNKKYIQQRTEQDGRLAQEMQDQEATQNLETGNWVETYYDNPIPTTPPISYEDYDFTPEQPTIRSQSYTATTSPTQTREQTSQNTPARENIFKRLSLKNIKKQGKKLAEEVTARSLIFFTTTYLVSNFFSKRLYPFPNKYIYKILALPIAWKASKNKTLINLSKQGIKWTSKKISNMCNRLSS